MERADVIVVGGGLAGLSCGLELSLQGPELLLLEAGPVVGGRTSSWIQDGMPVESGLHRVLGFYEAFPSLLRKAGIDVNQIVYWEDEVEIRLPDGRGNGVFGAAPLFHITGLIGHMAIAMLVPMPLVLFGRFEPGLALEQAERHRPTFTVAAITAFIALLHHPDAAGRDMSSLTKVYSGGAPIAPAIVERFERIHRQVLGQQG